ncbi:hypothetical protein ACSGVL_003338 [Salmonella enterica]|nr:hypothetical protein [Salmonella enterica subsp. enterica]
MRSIGYVFGAFVIMPIAIIIINMFFFRGNKVTQEQITHYVNDSKVIEVYIPEAKYDDEIDEDAFHRGDETKQNYESYQTRLSRKHSGSNWINRFIFFSKKHNKYLVLLTFDGFDYTDAFNTDKNDSRNRVVGDGHYVLVRVNNKQWNDMNYGTEVNPVPVFGVTLSGRGYEDKGPGVLEEQRSFFDVSDNLNRVFVGQYLNYFLPEDEFEKFFAE